MARFKTKTTIFMLGLMPLLVATPAWPQTLPQGQMASQSARATARPNVQASVRDVVRGLGLQRQTADLAFKRTVQTRDRAEFVDVTMRLDKGEEIKIGSIIITRAQSQSNETQQFNISFKNYVSPNARVDDITLEDVRGSLSLPSVVEALTSGAVPPETSNLQTNPQVGDVYIGRAILSNVKIQATQNAQDGNATIGEMTVRDLIFNGRITRFQDIEVTRLGLSTNYEISVELPGTASRPASPNGENYGSMRLEVARMSARGLHQAAGLLPGSDASNRLDLKTLFLTGASLEGFVLRGNFGNGPSQSPLEFKIARFNLGDLKEGVLQSFSMSGLEAQFGRGETVMRAHLEMLRLTDLNLNYFAAFSDAIQDSVRNIATKPADENGAAQAPVPNPTDTPSPMLKDILKGGPLDNGVRGFEIKNMGFELAGAKINFSGTQLALTQNEQGIITRSTLTPMNLNFSWADATGQVATTLQALTSILGENQLALTIGVDSTFDPARDRTAIDRYQLQIANVGEFDVRLRVDGFARLYANTSLRDLMSLSTASADPSTAGQQASLAGLLRLFGPLELVDARVQLTDKGGLDKAAAFAQRIQTQVATQGAAAQGGQAPTAQQARSDWANQQRASAAKKDNSRWQRELSVGLARWFETGGTLSFSIAPAQPVSLGALIVNPATQLPNLGLRQTVTPAVVASTSPTAVSPLPSPVR